MRKLMRLSVAVALGFSVLAAATASITLKRQFRIGGEEQDLIYRWSGLCTDDAENVYVADMQDHAIKKFDRHGKFIAKAGREGEGPGEFASLGHIAHCRGKLYVSQQMNPGLTVLATDLGYLGRIVPELLVMSMAGRDDRLFVSSPFQIDTPSRVAGITENGALDQRVVNPKKGGQPDFAQDAWAFFKDMASVAVDEKQAIYCASLWINRVAKYDREHRLLKEVSPPQLGKALQASRRSVAGLPQEMFFKDIELDARGYVYLLCGRMMKGEKQGILVLDRGLEYVTTLHLQESSHLLHVSKSNRLYARAEGGMAVDVYAIQY